MEHVILKIVFDIVPPWNLSSSPFGIRLLCGHGGKCDFSVYDAGFSKPPYTMSVNRASGLPFSN